MSFYSHPPPFLHLSDFRFSLRPTLFFFAINHLSFQFISGSSSPEPSPNFLRLVLLPIRLLSELPRLNRTSFINFLIWLPGCYIKLLLPSLPSLSPFDTICSPPRRHYFRLCLIIFTPPPCLRDIRTQHLTKSKIMRIRFSLWRCLFSVCVDWDDRLTSFLVVDKLIHEYLTFLWVISNNSDMCPGFRCIPQFEKAEAFQ